MEFNCFRNVTKDIGLHLLNTHVAKEACAAYTTRTNLNSFHVLLSSHIVVFRKFCWCFILKEAVVEHLY